MKTAEGIKWEKSEYFVTIGHEMAHAIDPVKVNFGYTWFTTRGGSVSKGEILATHYENMIRAESGLPLRTHYGGTYNTVSGTIVPLPQSRIIDKMGNSVYYGHPSSSGKQKQISKATINDGLKAEGGEILKGRYNYYDGE